MSEKILLKDTLLGVAKVEKISTEIQAVFPSFAKEDFVLSTIQKFPQLALKERIVHIAIQLRYYLPSDYQEATTILIKALPPMLDTHRSDDDFGEFIYASYSEFVARYGCREDVVDFSLEALKEITKRFSVEFSIRDFIDCYPQKTLAMLERCIQSNNYHERRLVSESLRPKLPWAKKITLSYTIPLKYLDKLYSDHTRYVTRSVANHLNDISKIDAPLVIKRLKKWKETQIQNHKEMDYIISHSLRTLIKQGDEEALAFLGYEKNPPIVISAFKLHTRTMKADDTLHFTINILAKETTKLMIDYLIFYKTKREKLSPKVYKLKKVMLEKNESIKLTKKHLIGANMSTRKLYRGQHKVHIQINGKIYVEEWFTLDIEENK